MMNWPAGGEPNPQMMVQEGMERGIERTGAFQVGSPDENSRLANDLETQQVLKRKVPVAKAVGYAAVRIDRLPGLSS